MFLLTERKPRQRRDHGEQRSSCYRSKPFLLLLLLLGASGFFIVNVMRDDNNFLGNDRIIDTTTTTTEDVRNDKHIDASFAIKNTAVIRTIATSSTTTLPLKKCHPSKLDMGCDLGERCKKQLLIGITIDDNDNDNGIDGNADDNNFNSSPKKNVENDTDKEQESWYCLPASSMVRDT
jgi:hypothetical protein